MKKKEDKQPKTEKTYGNWRSNIFAKNKILQYDYNRFLLRKNIKGTKEIKIRYV